MRSTQRKTDVQHWLILSDLFFHFFYLNSLSYLMIYNSVNRLIDHFVLVDKEDDPSMFLNIPCIIHD
jgi:hypothetical protein